MTSFPKPNIKHPVILPDGSSHKGTVFLGAAINHPRMLVGDYTYASAHTPPSDWAAHLAPYLYDFSPETLTIGKFCQIASGVQFITSSANHRYDGISSFPFAIFGESNHERPPSLPDVGPDIAIGHDCWIGSGATIMPGATLGDGVIVGARAVVTGTVPDYAIIAGNPARLVRKRFSPEQIDKLKEIAWWLWPIEKIMRCELEICNGDIAALARAKEMD